MPDEILTLPEVAQLLKVAEKTVYTMAQKGEFPAFMVDRLRDRRKHAVTTAHGVRGHLLEQL
ncbi:helix-turn-helix transcriptional regulator [Hyalangium versicolor]|uniref:helix-turn-helix transcriptional regulator n=1 Tax=Hyalangium versicolor TaxID=2861190 RepID=UPI001CCDDC9E|nr:helix-turn-helix domain-containing protein [Hyalangium versicolor]